jgi:hypothetical protein
MSNHIQACKTRFAYLNDQFDRTLGVRMWTMMGMSKQFEKVSMVESLSCLILSDTDSGQLDLLAKLPSVHTLQAGHDRVNECLPGTRLAILHTIDDWLSDIRADRPQILWLHGLAGTGKSTLSATVASSLEKSHRLGGTFFFSRTAAERNKPQSVFSAIVSQLVTAVPRLAEQIFAALEENPSLGDSAPRTQFSKLIARPLAKAVHGLALPVVIILDALDECADPVSILSPIEAELSNLPPVFKILITSRPEMEIKHLLVSMGSSLYHLLLNHNEEVDNDIHTFIANRLASIAANFGFDPDWPGDDNRRVLVQKSNGLFIWASTAIKFIADRNVENPKRQLRRILDNTAPTDPNSSPWLDLDSLYLQVLQQAFTQQSETDRFSTFKKVVGAIITIRDPLDATPDDLGHTVKLMVRRLQAVLIIPSDKLLKSYILPSSTFSQTSSAAQTRISSLIRLCSTVLWLCAVFRVLSSSIFAG